MTLATAITIIETLFVFHSPTVAIASDMMGGVYVATANKITHFVDDSPAETVSRTTEELLSGITDIEFSGTWLYALLGERKLVKKFDRRLQYIGDINVMITSEKIALTPQNDFWLYDEFSGRMAKYSSIGDPVEIIRATGSAAYLDNAQLIGVAEWQNFSLCPPLRPGQNIRTIAGIDVPILYVPQDNLLMPGLEYDAAIHLFPTIQKLWLSNGKIAYATTDDSIFVCGAEHFQWIAEWELPNDIVISQQRDGIHIYAIVENFVAKVTLKWQR